MVRGYLPVEEAAEHVRPPRELLVLQLRRQGHRRRQESCREADFREARHRAPDRAAVARALRLDPGQDQCQAGWR